MTFRAKEWEKQQIPPWLQRSVVYPTMMVSVEQWVACVIRPKSGPLQLLLEGLWEFVDEKTTETKDPTALGVYALMWVKNNSIQPLKWVPRSEKDTEYLPRDRDKKADDKDKKGLVWLPSLVQQAHCPLDAVKVKVKFEPEKKRRPNYECTLDVGSASLKALNAYQADSATQVMVEAVDAHQVETLLRALKDCPSSESHPSASASRGSGLFASGSSASSGALEKDYQRAFEAAEMDMDLSDKAAWMAPEFNLARLTSGRVAPVIDPGLKLT